MEQVIHFLGVDYISVRHPVLLHDFEAVLQSFRVTAVGQYADNGAVLLPPPAVHAR